MLNSKIVWFYLVVFYGIIVHMDYLIPNLVFIYIYIYLIMLSVKQGCIKYHFLNLWYDTGLPDFWQTL